MATILFTRTSAPIITSIGHLRTETYYGVTPVPFIHLTNLWFYIQDNKWINQTLNYEDPSNTPTESYFELATSAATVAAVQYEMSFTATNFIANEKNTRLYITFTNAAGFVAITLAYYFMNTADLITVNNSNQINNKFRLTKDNVNNILVVDNSAVGDVYTQFKDNRLSMWIQDNFNANIDFGRCQIIEKNTFYEVNDISRFTNIQFTWSACKANALDCESNTTVTFSATDNIGIVPTRTNWFLIDTLNNNSAITFQDNYTLNQRNNSATYDVRHEIPFTGAASCFNSVSNYVANQSVSVVDGTKLICGHTYRFIIVIETATATYSFICDEFTAEHCLCLCAPAVVDNFIADYLQRFNGIVSVTPQERLSSNLTLDITTYDACRPTPFCDALQTVTMTLYEQVSATTRHILDVKSINRNALGVLVSSSIPDFTCSAVFFTIEYIFRVRYEADIPNILTLVNNLNVGQLSNQDWTNRSLLIDYVFTLNDGTYQDTLTFRQGFRVHDYNPATTNDMDFYLEDADLNTPVNSDFICNGKTFNLRICSTTTMPDGAWFISGIDKETFNINNFIENDNFASADLPQLTNAAVNNSVSQYTLNKACTEIDLLQLPTETNMRFVAIKKMLVIPPTEFCCGDPEFANLFDLDYLDLISRMSVTPNLARRKIIANTIEQLKAQSLWDKMDVIYFIAAHDRQAGRLNWKSASYTLTEINWGVTNHFVNDIGMQPAVLTIGYYDTNWNMLTNSVTYTQNSASMWLGNENSSGGTGMGSYTGSVRSFIFRDSSTYNFANSAVIAPFGLAGNAFIDGYSRCNALDYNAYNSFTLDPLAYTVAGSIAPPNFTMYIRALNLVGTPDVGLRKDDTQSFAAAGGCLTEDEQKAFYQILRCYFLAINDPFFNSKFPAIT